MAIARMPRESLRHDQGDLSRLTWAFIISCAVHLVLFGGYWGGKKLNLWDNLHLPQWLTPVAKVAKILEKKLEPPKEPRTVPSLVFVDVSASQATAEPPKDAKYYSDRNSIAANPKADEVNGVPKVDGKQTKVIKTASVEPEKFVPLQPAPPPNPKAPPAKKNSTVIPPIEPPKPTPAQAETKSTVPSEGTKPKAAMAPGDLAMAKPAPPTPDDGKSSDPPPPPTPPRRPRTIEEALAQLGSDRLPGEKMKQNGGVTHQGVEPGFDVAASPFGAYDRALINAVSSRWYSLLDARDFASDSRGKVVVQFRLHYDGRITDVNISENSAGEMMGLICQKALVDPAPFPVWPADMRRLLGDTRNIQFTFYYE
jgi:hypothetical protein